MANQEVTLGSKKDKVFDKMTYAICAIIFGAFGVQHFIAGRKVMGVLSILFCWTIVPELIGIIQAIVVLFRPESRLRQIGLFKYEGVESSDISSSTAGSIFSLSGTRSEIVVYNDKLTIAPIKSAYAALSTGFRGTKTIYFNTITGIEIKACTSPLIGGYLQFEVYGARQPIIGTDENTFEYTNPNDNELVEKIKIFVEEKMKK